MHDSSDEGARHPIVALAAPATQAGFGRAAGAGRCRIVQVAMLMRRRHTVVSTLMAAFALVTVLPAFAQQGPAGAFPAAQARPASAAPASPTIDVSLERIRRQLRETPPSKESQSSLLKLEYYVQVVGTPPPIDFFKDFNIGRVSPVQYGGMTHSEFLRITAPFWRKW
jgi:hypothetical protein